MLLLIWADKKYNTPKNPCVVNFATQKNPFWPKCQTQKNPSDPPSLKYVSGAPGRRGLWNSLYSSPGEVCMSMLSLCSYYGVRKNTDCYKIKSVTTGSSRFFFSNNGLNFSFNCLFTSNILWVENDTWQKTIKVGFMLHTYRLLLAKGAFYRIRKSEISFVLRIIKANYRLKF